MCNLNREMKRNYILRSHKELVIQAPWETQHVSTRNLRSRKSGLVTLIIRTDDNVINLITELLYCLSQ